MAADLEIHGAEVFADLAKVLRRVGDRELQSELYRGINRATKGVKDDIRASALSTLPSRGGLAARVAKSRLSTRRRTGFRTAGIRIVGTSGYDIASMNRGRLRHPVHGNRGVWVTQTIPAGWWTEPTEAAAPDVRKELVEVLDDITDQIIRKLR